MEQLARSTPPRTRHRSLVATRVALAISLAIASYPASAEPAGRSQGQLLRRGYDSQVTAERREYFVYLPTGYHTEPGKRWPVILFLHGGGERGDAMEDLDMVLVHGPVAEAWIQGRDLPFIMISPQMPLFDRPRRGAGQPAPERIEDGPPPPRRYGRRPTQPMARVTDPSIPSFADSPLRGQLDQDGRRGAGDGGLYTLKSSGPTRIGST